MNIFLLLYHIIVHSQEVCFCDYSKNQFKNRVNVTNYCVRTHIIFYTYQFLII